MVWLWVCCDENSDYEIAKKSGYKSSEATIYFYTFQILPSKEDDVYFSLVASLLAINSLQYWCEGCSVDKGSCSVLREWNGCFLLWSLYDRLFVCCWRLLTINRGPDYRAYSSPSVYASGFSSFGPYADTISRTRYYYQKPQKDTLEDTKSQYQKCWSFVILLLHRFQEFKFAHILIRAFLSRSGRNQIQNWLN